MNQGNTSAAFFVDADNMGLNAVTQAFDILSKRFQAVTVRRAYGGHQKLQDLKDVLSKNGIRGYVNQGKGTTDVALVVDIMDLLHLNRLPSVVALASSDADFAPLALRLREAGIQVLCFAQEIKAADLLLTAAYAEVIYVTDAAHSPIAPVELAGSEESAHRAETTTLVSSNGLEKAPVQIELNPETGTSAASETLSKEADAQAVRRILAALPKWLPDTVKQLNQLGAPLLEKGIKKGNKPLHEVFRKYPAYFKVLPTTGQPRQVRLLQNP